jgi:hypothetical protein
MKSEDLLTRYMQDVMLDIIAALYANGIRQVHLGGMMRLLGLPDAIATEYDEDRMKITSEFADIIEHKTKISVPGLPAGTTIH